MGKSTTVRVLFIVSFSLILFACQSFPSGTKQEDQLSEKQSVLPTQLIIEKDPEVMVLIPAGNFTMGNEKGSADEKPSHEVYCDPFYIDSSEVTCERYARFLEGTGYPPHQMWNPELDRPEDPVIGVTWQDASAFARWAGKRLPTEAEWEKAARGGLIEKKYPWGDTIDTQKANYKSFGITPVKSYGANGFGLYDMAGNVWEWCQDWYNQEYYRVSENKNPKGPMLGAKKVVRGGAWYCNEDALQVFNRHKNDPTMGSFHIGFRCARSANGKK